MVVAGLLGVKLNDDPGLRVWSDRALELWEREYIALVREELIGSRLCALIDDVQKSVGGTCLLYLTKVNRSIWEINVDSIGLTHSWNFKFITTKHLDAKVGARVLSNDRRRICDSYFLWTSWLNKARLFTQLKGRILTIIIDGIYLELGLHLGIIPQFQLFCIAFSNCQLFKI